MAKLRDYFFSDLSAIFNENEFAEEVNIDGKMMDVVIDSDLLKEHNLKNGGEGLARGELLFHAQKSDFENKPLIDDVMRFNKDIFIISDVQESSGMYSITLVGYQS